MAINGGVGRVLKPIAIAQTIDQAAVEGSEIAGDLRQLWIAQRGHFNLIARQVVGEPTDLIILCATGSGEKREAKRQRESDQAIFRAFL
jgi:hypothetical protein